MIGPSFPEELRQAGITDFRFTWGTDGLIEYDPDMPAAERAKVEAVLAAHDGPLSAARHQALAAADAEAARRIAEPFGKPPDSFDLVWKELNAIARAVQIVNKKLDGSALPEERLALEVLDGIYGRIEAIRDTQDKAKAALVGAKSVEEVEAISAKVAWPWPD